jgi:hypothetical protein
MTHDPATEFSRFCAAVATLECRLQQRRQAPDATAKNAKYTNGKLAPALSRIWRGSRLPIRPGIPIKEVA